MVNIIIPVYQSLNKFELLSLEQLKEVLSVYDKTIVCPDSLNLEFEALLDDSFKIIRFPGRYFKSPQTYNRLLRSYDFFNLFNSY